MKHVQHTVSGDWKHELARVKHGHYSHLLPSNHIPRICGQIMRVWEQSWAPTKRDFSCGHGIVNQFRYCARQVVLLNMHKCLDHCKLQYNWGQEYHKRVGHKPKLPWSCSYVTAVSMTLMCVLEDWITVVPDSSSAFVTYCMWHKLSLAMRLGGMILVNHVYCTQFELWF